MLRALQPLLARYNRTYITDLIRQVLATLRQDIVAGAHTTQIAEQNLVHRIATRLQREDQSPPAFGHQCNWHSAAYQPRAGTAGASCRRRNGPGGINAGDAGV